MRSPLFSEAVSNGETDSLISKAVTSISEVASTISEIISSNIKAAYSISEAALSKRMCF